MEKQAFISYSSEDLAFVTTELVPACHEAGFKPWYDVEGVKVAEQWERKILQSLLDSRWLLLVMSPDSTKSEWIKDELQVALGEAAIPVIPLLWKDCKGIEFHIRVPRLQYIDFRKDVESAHKKLIQCMTGVEEPVVRIEQDIPTELISIVAALLSRYEINHLRNLAQRRTNYTGRRTMRHEIRHLCDLGILVRKQNRTIGEMKNGEKHNLADFVELSPTGKAIVEKLPRIRNLT